MRQARAKVDANQPEIVRDLRSVPGVVVTSTAAIGNGFPDIVVGYDHRNWLFEIKNPEMEPSKRRLTPMEILFHENWKLSGQVDVIETAEDAMKIMGIMK